MINEMFGEMYLRHFANHFCILTPKMELKDFSDFPIFQQSLASATYGNHDRKVKMS